VQYSVKEARARLGYLLTRAQRGERVTITRRGSKIARLEPVTARREKLPSLEEFRRGIKVKGKLSDAVARNRQEERY
jgi:prevent-host-death family protein